MKYLAVFSCIISLVFGPADLCFCEEEKVLNVYNWANAMPESIIRKFEAETGIQVNYSTYTSNEVLYAKLKANPKAGYDIVVPSTYFVDRLRKQNMLQKIDKSKLKNIGNLDPSLLHLEHDPDNDYSIPFLWNATGIVLNDQYHSVKDVSSWADLWNERYRNQLLMLDDTREVFSIALLTLGFSPNDRDPKHIAKAFIKLKDLMPNIKLFNTEAIHSILIDEDITLGVSWSGEIARARVDNPHLQFVYPQEGFVLSIDSMVIPENAKHPNNAHLFLDFILRPEIAKEVSLDTGFATTNTAAYKLLPEAVRNDPIIYPSAEIRKRGYFQTDVGDAAPLYEKYFELLKLGG